MDKKSMMDHSLIYKSLSYGKNEHIRSFNYLEKNGFPLMGVIHLISFL